MEPIVIPFIPNVFGRVWIYAHVLTGDRKSLRRTLFKLDSGSDFTTISIEELKKLGYTGNFLRACPFYESGASGASDEIKLSLQYITNVSIKFGNRELQGCRVFFALGTTLRSLLGSDILKYFNFEINYDSGEFRLAEAVTRPRIVDGEPRIQIYSLEQNEP